MNAYGVGGTIRTTYNTAAALARRHEVEIVSVRREPATPHFPVDPAITLTALSAAPEVREARRRDRRPAAVAGRRIADALEARPSRVIDPNDARHDHFDLLADVHLLRYLRSVRDGVLIGTRPGLNLAIARFARPRVLRVGQEHLHLAHHGEALRASIVRHYPRLDVVAALTRRDARDYRRLLGTRTRVVRVPNAVPDIRGARARGGGTVVVAAGRLTRQKGFDRLIPAFAKVVAVHPEWTLRIFGEGPKADALQGRIDDLGMARHITLMGHSSDLHHEMAGAAMYVMSSRFEGFPMVLLEAMACGLPVVSFNCRNGPKDVIDHGVNGLLVPRGDVDALAGAMIALIEDPQRRRALGERALGVADEYHIDRVAARWERILARGLAAKRTAG